MPTIGRFFAKAKKTKIVLIIVILFLIIGSQLVKQSMNSLDNFGAKELSQVPQITHLPWDANQIYALTPFRSNVGHDFTVHSWDGETCRTLKHYVNFPAPGKDPNIRSLPTPGHPNINLYAPFDGTVSVEIPGKDPIHPGRKSLGVSLVVTSRANSHWKVILGHSDPLPNLKNGTKVKSGDLIGTVGPKDQSEISFQSNLSGNRVVYLSIFEHITQQAFAPFTKLGYSPANFVLSRATADSRHYKCVGPGGWQLYVQQNPTDCSNPCVPPGFISIRPNPFANSGNGA